MNTKNAQKISELTDPKSVGRDIKLLSFDLDGTLINSSGEISEASIREIARVKKSGVAIAIATGRPLFTSEDIIDQIGVEGASMFFSGSFVTDVFTRIPVLECHMIRATVEEIVKFAREHKITLELYTGEEFFVDEESELTKLHIKDYLKIPPRVLNLLKLSRQEKFLKSVFMVERGSKEETLVNEFCAKLTQCTVSTAFGAKHPDIVFYNITSLYASRERAFQALLEFYELDPKQVMSFGDAPSDMPFLSLSGVGIAMGNADQQTASAARFVTHSVDNDGVAYALNALF